MLAIAVGLLCQTSAILEVGPGKAYSTIESAVEAARPGDTVRVFPSPDHYSHAHVMINKANLTLVGMGPQPLAIVGAGFEYSGSGSVPRAIFQINGKGTGFKLQHFDLSGAHNASFNGAGVRIAGANRVSVSDCNIHDNDMGIMSNGTPNSPEKAADQVIERCRIFQNGNLGEAGYNHNLYLGGESVTVRFCEIFKPLTGHNLKCRAHFTLVEYCHIHDSLNRELDFVDARETEREHSNAVLIGNLIVKDPMSAGNHGTIHFGQESGKRNGTLFLLNNTIITPFASAVVELDSTANRCDFSNNVIVNTNEAHPTLVSSRGHLLESQVTGGINWISRGYGVPPSLASGRLQGTTFRDWPLATEGINTVSPDLANKGKLGILYEDGDGLKRDGNPTFRRTSPSRWMPAKSAFLGAG